LLGRLETEWEIRNALCNLPGTLFEAYDRIILAIQRKSVHTARLVKAVLEWTSFFADNDDLRPSNLEMNVLGLLALLSVEVQDNEDLVLDYLNRTKAFADVFALLRSCGCLVKISDCLLETPASGRPGETQRISPAHYSISVSAESQSSKFADGIKGISKFKVFTAARESKSRLVFFNQGSTT